MNDIQPVSQRRFLRAVGSLWFAAVLLVLLLFGLACATVYESMYGTERALFTFYRAWWFTGLLCLFSINVLAAVAVKWPLTRRQIGFVLTHVSLVVILVGALVTRYVGLDGQIALTEGQSAGYFTIPEDTLTVINLSTGDQADANLTAFGIGGFDRVDQVRSSALENDDLSIDVLQYLPDAQIVQAASNDAPHEHLAVEVSLSSDATDAPVWVFEDRPAQIGPTNVALRKADQATIAKLLQMEGTGKNTSLGQIIIEHGDQEFAFAAEDCKDTPCPFGDEGLTVKLLRYLPHATVGEGGQLVNASPQPVNPAIEVEIGSGAEVESRIAFAKYPDYQSMHETGVSPSTLVTFQAEKSVAPFAPVEVIVGPDGTLYARLTWAGTSGVIQPIELGSPIDTPWSGRKLVVSKKFDRARHVTDLAPTSEIRKERRPALKITLNAMERSSDMWMQRGQPRTLKIGDTQYQMVYGNRIVRLGFDVKLDKFRVGYYPGGRRPRSFESTVSLNDPTQGGTQTRLISMNNPTSFAGYNFYQSSYRMGNGPTMSILSVSRDPGQAVVFVGYFGVMIGMLVVLLDRMKTRTRLEEARGVTHSSNGKNGHKNINISLYDAEAQCESASHDPLPDRSRARGATTRVPSRLR